MAKIERLGTMLNVDAILEGVANIPPGDSQFGKLQQKVLKNDQLVDRLERWEESILEGEGQSGNRHQFARKAWFAAFASVVGPGINLYRRHLAKSYLRKVSRIARNLDSELRGL